MWCERLGNQKAEILNCSSMTCITVLLTGLIYGRTPDAIFFYIHVSVHRESNLITAHQDATYSVYYISVCSSTCFGC